MKKKSNQVELLAPAGNVEKLEIAAHYGADAVYLADQRFSLRNFSENFSPAELKQAAAFTKKNGIKMYVACNIFSRTTEAHDIRDYLNSLERLEPDAVIVADPGVFLIARETIPHIPLHLSTQANTTNLNAVRFWENLGVKRVNLARELSLNEIKKITSQCAMETEAFVHGAVCVSYSGRCLLSRFLSDRDSNRGQCSHPCRWQYTVCEEQRPGQYLPIAEDERGTYLFNSKDLCMVEHLDKMIAAGLTALKIEGRMKSIHYLASTVKTYREAIDAYYADPEKYAVRQRWLEMLEAVSLRGYSTNFYLEYPDAVTPAYIKSPPATRRTFAAKVLQPQNSHCARVIIRNKLCRDDTIDILTPNGPPIKDTVHNIINEEGESVDVAQPNSRVTLCLGSGCQTNDLIRKIW